MEQNIIWNGTKDIKETLKTTLPLRTSKKITILEDPKEKLITRDTRKNSIAEDPKKNSIIGTLRKFKTLNDFCITKNYFWLFGDGI